VKEIKNRKRKQKGHTETGNGSKQAEEIAMNVVLFVE